MRNMGGSNVTVTAGGLEFTSLNCEMAISSGSKLSGKPFNGDVLIDGKAEFKGVFPVILSEPETAMNECRIILGNSKFDFTPERLNETGVIMSEYDSCRFAEFIESRESK